MPSVSPLELPLLDHFSRFVAIVRPPFADLEASIKYWDALEVSVRSGARAIWRPLSQSDQHNQGEFLLPWVRDYLSGVVPDGTPPLRRDCVARACNHDVLKRLKGLTVSLNSVTVRFSIRNVELYAFSTGLVALVTECVIDVEKVSDNNPSADPRTLRRLVDLNYALAKLAPQQAPRIRRPSRVPLPEDAGRSVASFLPSLDGPEGMTLAEILSALMGSPQETLPSALDGRAMKVQCFVSVDAAVVTETPDTLTALAEPFYYLRRVEKPSYRPAPGELAIDDHSDIVRTFDNIVLGASVEGFAVMLVDTGHKFFEQFSSRVRTSYFAHYLLALHQRAALLQLALEAGRLPRMTEDAGTNTDFFNQVRRLRLRAVEFNLHHRFAQVSTMTHYARAYDVMCGTLRVPALLEEVRDEIAEFDEILRIERDQADASRQAESAHRDRRLNEWLAYLGPISLLLSLYGSNLPPWSNMETYRAPFWLPLGACVALTALLAWRARSK